MATSRGATPPYEVEAMAMDGEDGEGSSPQLDLDADHLEHARPRKRTRRACDKCSISRTRCDGQCPCRRCEDYGYSCRYNREIKKRGRVPASLAASMQADVVSLKAPHVLQSPSPPISSREDSISSAQYQSGLSSQRHRDSSSTNRSQVSASRDGESPATLSSGQRHIQPSLPTTTRPHGTPYIPTTAFTPTSAHLQLASILDPSGESHIRPRTHDSLPHVASLSNRSHEADSLGSDGSGDYPSPANPSGILGSHAVPPPRTNPPRFSTTATALGRERASLGSAAGQEASLPDLQRRESLHYLYKAPSSDCRYRFLDPVLPFIRDIIPASVACDLLDVYLTDPGSSLFRCASPYILTRIFRKRSILHPTNPRPTTPALLATMLWCSAQTADIVLLHVPGSRSKITNALYDLSTSLISERDPDRWRRIHGGLCVENEQTPNHYSHVSMVPSTTATNEPAGVIDDVLTFILLSIAVSGGDFKSDCMKWWNKAIRLALALRLNREDERCSDSVSPCANPICSCRRDPDGESLTNAEAREERRRVFWLIYCLDRHLALSFNAVLKVPDSYCEIYAPLPETVWESLDNIPAKDLPARVLGPPNTITGTGYFEYFLPLMAILGDIIEVHHRRQHPRLGMLNDSQAVAVISESLATVERSLEQLQRENDMVDFSLSTSGGPTIKSLISSVMPQTDPATPAVASAPGLPPRQQQQQPTGTSSSRSRDRSRLRLVTAYSTHILHVLHVLLHGKWDAICMLDDDDDWITSTRFNDCASHAIGASQAVSDILKYDPELTFMPYLFGIYLLHGSFILLLFADRMPQLGPNQSVEQACEVIVRAHEVCVVTLSTEFQKNFRKVLRSTLYSVRGSSPTEWEEHKARRRALSLYRWTKGAKGLAL